MFLNFLECWFTIFVIGIMLSRERRWTEFSKIPIEDLFIFIPFKFHYIYKIFSYSRKIYIFYISKYFHNIINNNWLQVEMLIKTFRWIDGLENPSAKMSSRKEFIENFLYFWLNASILSNSFFSFLKLNLFIRRLKFRLMCFFFLGCRTSKGQTFD